MSLAILCPGQGGQHPGMFDKVRAHPAARPVFDALQAIGGADAPTLAADIGRFANSRAQPLVCAGTLAHWQALRAQLPTPLLALGYSVGELAAHAVAGSLDASTCLALAAERARLMDAASPADAGLMSVQGIALRPLQVLAEEHGVEIAIVNGEDHAILGGPRAALEQLQRAARGARMQPLPVSVPAHTHWLRDAAEAFAATLADAALEMPMLTVLAGIDARPVADRARVLQTLPAQIARSVQWSSVLQQARERGATVFLELGPGSALARMARDLGGCEARSVEDFHTLEGVVEWVQRASERAR